MKAKGLLSQMLSLPEDWDYTLAGLSYINREKIDAIREAVRELERAGYIQRSRERDEKGRLRGTDYIIYEQPPNLDLPTLENPTLENPTQEKPTLENPMQFNKDIQKTDLPKKEKSNTDLSSKKYRKGIEYGSARWGNAEDIKPYTDPVFQNNVLLTQTEAFIAIVRALKASQALGRAALTGRGGTPARLC